MQAQAQDSSSGGAEETALPRLPSWTASEYSVDVLDRVISPDPLLFDTAALGRVARKLGAEPFKIWFKPKRIVSPIYSFSGGIDKYSLFDLEMDSLPSLNSGRLEYRIGIEAWGGSKDWIHGPALAFLRSAYLEEVIPDYRRRSPEAFVELEPKSKEEFWKRNLYSMGYATAYAAEDNPFSHELRSSVKWGYCLDAIVYLTLAAGAANGDVGTLIGGAASGALLRLLYIGPRQAHIEYHNAIIRSGYGIPRHAEYDSLQSRSEDPEHQPVWTGTLKRRNDPAGQVPGRGLEYPARQAASAGDSALSASMTPPTSAALEASPTARAPRVLQPNAFAQKPMPAKTPAGLKAAIVILSPAVGMLIGTGYYKLRYGDRPGDSGALGAIFGGMFIGLAAGIQIAWEI